jgi:hypothetical protein
MKCRNRSICKQANILGSVRAWSPLDIADPLTVNQPLVPELNKEIGACPSLCAFSQ